MLLTFGLALQLNLTAGPVPPPPMPVPAPTATGATAARATTPPVLDGIDTDDIWRTAPAITQFRQHDPVEDGDPRFRTEARIGYDEKYLYVFVRAYDPRPDSVMAFLSRRDVPTKSDWIHVMIDGYMDRRTGFRFTVNPRGVKRDVYHSQDSNEDPSWDAVWDVVTKIDSLGWTAEYRVPFNQIRYPQAESHSFGVAIWRDIARYSERMSWPVFRRSRTGFVSQWGTVDGFVGITSPGRLEMLPYTVATDAPRPGATGVDRHQTLALGADLKYGMTSNLTLDVTMNPDFGQVEADPATLNLTAFEQYFQERRPFFLEGASIFSFGGDLFYSRRIGRAPQLSGVYSADDNPTNTTIIGAAKITGRTAGGLNVGVLNAVTQREIGANRSTIEPTTNYLVTRLAQDLRNGNSGVGMILTATSRQLDADTRDYLHENAVVFGVDGRHRFAGNNYQLSGSVVSSYVNGSEAALLRTQQNSAHFFQRTDSRLSVDSSATSLTGVRTAVSFGKTGGGIVRFNSSASYVSAGYDVNDLGFMNRADGISSSQWISLQFQKPTKLYRSFYVNFNQWNDWNTEGQLRTSGGNVNVNGQLANQWWAGGGFNVNGLGAVYDDRMARGGPAVRRQFRQNAWLWFETDARKSVSYSAELNAMLPDAAGSRETGVYQGLNYRLASRMQGSVGANYTVGRYGEQWFGVQPDTTVPAGKAYTFARLDQTTVAMTARFDFTMTPTLSLQLYAQPFITSGEYSNLRALDNARAAKLDERYRSFNGADPATSNFNVKQFRSNTVLRWEYRPGSVLFLVWQQGRGDFAGGTTAGDFQFDRDMGNLFKTRPDNTFLIKASYWFSM